MLTTRWIVPFRSVPRPFLGLLGPLPLPTGRRCYSARYEAFDKTLDADELKAARQWRAAFSDPDKLPKGTTTYARSSGPGGQHVNKTETKATTAWPVTELMATLPTLLRHTVRTSRYYTRASDSLTIQAQEQRSRSVNAETNRQKLYDELVALYEAAVPGESRPETATKYKQVCVFTDTRVYSEG